MYFREVGEEGPCVFIIVFAVLFYCFKMPEENVYLLFLLFSSGQCVLAQI